MTVKAHAIETHYGGCRFRSRTEARWAVFFDHINLNWEYEKEGYVLADGTRYLPDFWIPGLNFWIEVKGNVRLATDEHEKAMGLHNATGFPVAVVSGVPMRHPLRLFCTDIGNDNGGQGWWDDCQFVAGPRGLRIDIGSQGRGRFFCNDDWSAADVIGVDVESVDSSLTIAAISAKSARFEFGESGTNGDFR